MVNNAAVVLLARPSLAHWKLMTAHVTLATAVQVDFATWYHPAHLVNTFDMVSLVTPHLHSNARNAPPVDSALNQMERNLYQRDAMDCVIQASTARKARRRLNS